MTTFNEPVREETPLLGGEDTICWLRERHHRDQEDKHLIHEDQETLMGDILILQAITGRGGRDEKIKDYVEIICEGIRTEKKMARQSALLDIKAKEGMEKIKYMDLSETSVIKADIETTTYIVKNIDQNQRSSI